MSRNPLVKRIDFGPCPLCGVVISGMGKAVGLHPAGDQASGDAAICHGCGCISISVPGDIKRLRRASDHELSTIVRAPAVQAAIRSIWARNAEEKASRDRPPTLN